MTGKKNNTEINIKHESNLECIFEEKKNLMYRNLDTDHSNNTQTEK